jgi:hypothetical protein
MACTILPPSIDDLDPEGLAQDIREARARLAVLEAAARALRRAKSEKAEPCRLRFTKTSIAAIKPPTSGIAIYWDTVVSGLGVRVMPTGTRTYFLQRRTRDGTGIKLTVGRAGRITSEQARARAS